MLNNRYPGVPNDAVNIKPVSEEIYYCEWCCTNVKAHILDDHQYIFVPERYYIKEQCNGRICQWCHHGVKTPAIIRKKHIETWKELFSRQWMTGKGWSGLFGNDFQKRKFLEKEDAMTIIKTAQADAYRNVIDILNEKQAYTLIPKIEKIIEEIWINDDK